MILFDVFAYSALRKRGNIKVAFETQLMQELGTQGYVAFKQRELAKRRKRAWKTLGCLLLLATPPFGWLIGAILIIWWFLRNG